MEQRRLLACILILKALVGDVNMADTSGLDSFPSTAGETTVRRHTLKELRDQYVVKQHLDYSCGAAALATLMIFYYGEDTSEKAILDLLNIRLQTMTKEEQARKKRIGFSLLDLKIVAEQMGYQAAGFRLTLDQLRQLAAPVIVYVRPFDYHHFAVLRGIAGDRVFLADPSRANLRMSLSRFADEYGGIIFVLGRPGEESITNYPLALSRPDDYNLLGIAGPIRRVNEFGTYIVNWELRTQVK